MKSAGIKKRLQGAGFELILSASGIDGATFRPPYLRVDYTKTTVPPIRKVAPLQ